MLLGFKKRFKEPILFYSKVFTIRKRRKKQPKIGETIHMYTALRTKHCELISNKEKLKSIQNVRITIDKHPIEFRTGTGVGYNIRVIVDGRSLFGQELEEFYTFDGFKNYQDWAEYWLTDEKGKKKSRTGALMQLFHWTDLKY